jgi:hypothetical protein
MDDGLRMNDDINVIVACTEQIVSFNDLQCKIVLKNKKWVVRDGTINE